MSRKTTAVFALLVVAGGALPADANRSDEKLWDAVRRGKVAKLRKLLHGGVSPESRTVALSTAVSHDRPETFRVLWSLDNSDIAPDAIDFALC
jgi:hypothetical protein